MRRSMGEYFDRYMVVAVELPEINEYSCKHIGRHFFVILQSI